MPTNPIDKWFLSLTEKLEGWGILIFVAVTLLISGILSALIGLERYRKGENAGMRTHALLSIGCAMFMIISLWGIKLAMPTADYDISRIAAGSVTGIGFLGAGVIIKDKFTVKGLSTATTLWICATIGLATGAGFILEAVIGTCITLFLIFIRNRIIVVVDRKAPNVIVKCKKGYPALERIKVICDSNSLNMKTIDISKYGDKYVEVKVYFPYHTNPLLLDYFMTELLKEEDIMDVTKVMKITNKKFEDTHES